MSALEGQGWRDRRTLSGLLWLGVMLLAGCESGSGAPTRVQLAASKNIWSALAIVAREKGFARQEGVELEIGYVQAAKFAMDALVGSSTDCGLVVEANVAFLGFTGNKGVQLAATVAKSHDGAIVARRDAGIQQPADLRGKKVGVLQGTTSQIFAERFLEKHGMSVADVEVVNLQAVSIQTAIVEKGIDAGSLWEPFVYNVSKILGENAVVFRDPEVYTGYMNLAVRGDWAKANPDAVPALLRALRQAEAFVRDSPAEAQAIVAREINLDPEIVRGIWQYYQFGVGLDVAALQREIEREGEWIRKTQPGFADKPMPDYSIYFAPQYLSAAE